MIDKRSGALQCVLRYELWLVLGLAALGFALIPVLLGGIGLSWDALNHHIYLGWTAEHPRFDEDYLAASYQAYEYPYLYWPVYRLAMSGASGVAAGLVLGAINLAAVPPVWMVSRVCIPGQDWFAVALRTLGVALAFVNVLVLSLFDATANDFTSGIPLLWAVAFALRPVADPTLSADNTRAMIRRSGLLAGISVAFKLSNGPVAIALPLVWLWGAGRWRNRVGSAARGSAWALVGFFLAYGYWGWQLWVHFGNPIYPLYDHWFEALRNSVGWAR